jgi:hypothetical protein
VCLQRPHRFDDLRGVYHRLPSWRHHHESR